MRALAWKCFEVAAGLLQPRDREIVLGDLAEFEGGFWCGLSDVLGLAVRRQAELWTSWRPWAASVGLAWPASLFLMGSSVAATGALLHGSRWADGTGQLALLLVWAWMAGFAAGAISRKTLWASALASLLPCCFCLSLWPGSWMGALRLLVFVAPAAWGAWLGGRRRTLAPSWATIGAAAAMVIPFTWRAGGGLYGVGIWWPALYLAITARRKTAPV